MKAFIEVFLETGTNKIVIGMPHRGRLNVLANVMGKPLEKIFAEFQGAVPDQDSGTSGAFSGDVKYHLGTTFERDYKGKWLSMTILANPSHLECGNPVVSGRVRAE